MLCVTFKQKTMNVFEMFDTINKINQNKNMSNEELNEKNKAALEYLNSSEWLNRKLVPIEPTLSPEAEVALRLLPFVIADELQDNNYYILKDMIKKAQDLANQFMNYNHE